ncbi:MAG TPA: non-heme iron oxygenase ferredoxin subunit [Planktothrix sp.]
MSKFKIAKKKDIPPGKGRAFDVANLCIAVFNVGGKFYALDDTCPHKGASLSHGFLGDNDIACPLHNATFALDTGKGLSGPCGEGVSAYPVTLDGDDIEIEIG